MKYFKILALVGAIMLTCVNNSEAKAASWEKSFILDENSRDIKLMSNEENPWSDYDIRDDLEKEFQKRLLFKLRSLKTGMLISSEILKTNQIDSNEPVFMINRVVKRVVLIIKMRTFPS